MTNPLGECRFRTDWPCARPCRPEEARTLVGVEAEPVSTGGRSAREQRIIAGFEEIERFVEEHGRSPQHGEARDIFERLYAVRLDRMRMSDECREVLDFDLPDRFHT